jgi:AcrR family transcriptional regulator
MGFLVELGMAQPTSLSRRTDGRARLLEAAAKLFSLRGFDEVSVAELLEESGLKAPSLYHHFQDKEGLFLAWAMVALDRLAERLAAAQDVKGAAAALVQSPELDLLQLWRDMRLMRGEGSRDALETHVEFSVFRPLQRILGSQGLRCDRKAAEFFIHSSTALHPSYRGNAAADDSVSVLAEMIVQGSRLNSA